MASKYHPLFDKICVDCKSPFQVVANYRNRLHRCPGCQADYKKAQANKRAREKWAARQLTTQAMVDQQKELYKGWPLSTTRPAPIPGSPKKLYDTRRIASKKAVRSDGPFVKKGQRFDIYLILPGKSPDVFLCAAMSPDKKALLIPEWFFDWDGPNFEPVTPDEKRIDARLYNEVKNANKWASA